MTAYLSVSSSPLPNPPPLAIRSGDDDLLGVLLRRVGANDAAVEHGKEFLQGHSTAFGSGPASL